MKIATQELDRIVRSADAELDDAVFEDALNAMRLYIMFAFAQALLLQSFGHHVRHVLTVCACACVCELKVKRWSWIVVVVYLLSLCNTQYAQSYICLRRMYVWMEGCVRLCVGVCLAVVSSCCCRSCWNCNTLQQKYQVNNLLNRGIECNASTTWVYVHMHICLCTYVWMCSLFFFAFAFCFYVLLLALFSLLQFTLFNSAAFRCCRLGFAWPFVAPFITISVRFRVSKILFFRLVLKT